MTATAAATQNPISVTSVAADRTARDSSQGLIAGRQIEQLTLLKVAIVLAGLGSRCTSFGSSRY